MIEAKSFSFHFPTLLLLLNILVTVSGVFLGECNVTILSDHYHVSRKAHSDALVTTTCSPHILFRKYCNTCICHAEGNAFTCTIDECTPGQFTEDGAEIPEADRKPCTPFEYYTDDCNECFCKSSGFGGWCTNRDCNHPNKYEYTVLKQLD